MFLWPCDTTYETYFIAEEIEINVVFYYMVVYDYFTSKQSF